MRPTGPAATTAAWRLHEPALRTAGADDRQCPHPKTGCGRRDEVRARSHSWWPGLGDEKVVELHRCSAVVQAGACTAGEQRLVGGAESVGENEGAVDRHRDDTIEQCRPEPDR